MFSPKLHMVFISRIIVCVSTRTHFVLEYDKGDWFGVKTFSYDRISNLKELTTLWENGENGTSTTGVATANVTFEQLSQGNRADGIASNQSAVVFTDKVTNSATEKQEGGAESSEKTQEAPTA